MIHPLHRARLDVYGLALLLVAACDRPSATSTVSSGADAAAAPPKTLAPPRDLTAPVAKPFPPPHGPRAYVTNEASGDVSIIDLGSNEVVATVAVGKRPRGVQRSPDGRFVYVALSGSPSAGPDVKGPLPPADKSADAIGVLDAATGAIVDRLPSGSDPEQFALTKDGAKLVVSNEDAALASVIDLGVGPGPGGKATTKKVEKTIKVGEEPEGVTASPDGKWIYVTCESSSAVEVISTSTWSVTKEIKVGARPRSVAFLPDSSKAYVTSELGGLVTVLALPKHDLVKALKLEGPGMRPMGVAVSPDGKRAYVTTGHGGTLVVIDTAKDAIDKSIPVGRRPWGVALSPDGATAYTANGLSDDVSIVDTASGKETGKIKVGTKPWGIVVVP